MAHVADIAFMHIVLDVDLSQLNVRHGRHGIDVVSMCASNYDGGVYNILYCVTGLCRVFIVVQAPGPSYGVSRG